MSVIARVMNKPIKDLESYVGCGCLLAIIGLLISIFLIPMLVACGLVKYIWS